MDAKDNKYLLLSFLSDYLEQVKWLFHKAEVCSSLINILELKSAWVFSEVSLLALIS